MKYWVVALIMVAFVACNRNTYDSGDGGYSYLCADFVEAHANSDAKIDYVFTDDEDTLSMPSPFSSKYVTVKDTLYRGVLYYDIDTDENAVKTVTPVTYSPIPVLHVTPVNDSLKYDAMDFESMWCSKTGKYLNVSLILTTGQVNGSEGLHYINLTQSPTTITEEGKRNIHLVFSHDQNGVPQYYTARQYLSIPLDQFAKILEKGDSISISVKTSDGWVQKQILYQ